ncbi:pyruvate dehydrogenase e1 component subunit alpha [Vairimorpha apis BRL 01]|uniref:Pyruvate dehydrogenase e1 component subunit alpha n=1 Tax=Vairimorpha apis BRL 01 TaxID=1037528 RepID=T0LCJ9_9MICR|nr:pyruvate dehydrogenase e1 component subunit alpha [Vairimorpha apis BRL 01]
MLLQYYLIDKDSVKFTTQYTKKLSVKIYTNLLTLRLLEENSGFLYKLGKIRGFCHLVIGQENIYISLQQVLDKNDKVIGSYRCHGLAYICNITPEQIMAEMLGKSNGICKGKGGSMHLYNEQFYGGHGIVGAQISLGTGIAFALQYKNMNNVCFVFYGDGASNQGQAFESFNMAKLWKLPVVYVCEANKYGMWTPEENICSNTEYFKRGGNIPGIRISDEHIDKLIDIFKYAREYALKYGPIILQIDTYRLCNHSCLDIKDFYRSKEEVDKQKEKDCLKIFREELKNFISEDEIKIIENDVLKKFEEEAKKAEFGIELIYKELFKDVYK